jgi:phage terminase large subunit-like protein
LIANSFAVQLADALENSWPAVARPNQLPPPGDWWQIWLLLAGRGFGKTRTLAEWVCDKAASGQASRIALVAATAADARDVLVEGQSGILAVAPPWLRPMYEPSKRRLTWPNGAIATTFSAGSPIGCAVLSTTQRCATSWVLGHAPKPGTCCCSA